MQKVLGVDIGGVIVKKQDFKSDTSFFSDNYLNTPEMEDVKESIKSLNGEVGGSPFARVYIVSKCGENVQRKSNEWLDYHNYGTELGLDSNRRLFCRRRHEKAPIAEKFGITHFIDDRLDVLEYMIGIVPRLYLFRPNFEDMMTLNTVRSRSPRYNSIILVDDWKTLIRRLKEFA